MVFRHNAFVILLLLLAPLPSVGAAPIPLSGVHLSNPVSFDPASSLYFEGMTSFELTTHSQMLHASYSFSSAVEAVPGFSFLPDGFSLSILGSIGSFFDVVGYDPDFLGFSAIPEASIASVSDSFSGFGTPGIATGDIWIDIAALAPSVGLGPVDLLVTLFNEDDGISSSLDLTNIALNESATVQEPNVSLLLMIGLSGLLFVRHKTLVS